MKARVLVVYYSLYGHGCRLVEAAAEGVRSVSDVEATVRRVPETLPPEVIQKMGATEAQKQQAGVPVCTVDELPTYDGIIFGAPTYTGGPSAQFKAFEDASSYAVMTKGFGWKDKIAAGFTNSGSRSGDKLARQPSGHYCDECRLVRTKRRRDGDDRGRGVQH